MKQELVLAKRTKEALREIENLQTALKRTAVNSKFTEVYRTLKANGSHQSANQMMIQTENLNLSFDLLRTALEEAHTILLQRAKYDEQQQTTSGRVSTSVLRRKSAQRGNRK